MALVQVRRVDLAWKGGEVRTYDKLREASKKQGIPIQELLKKIAKESVK